MAVITIPNPILFFFNLTKNFKTPILNTPIRKKHGNGSKTNPEIKVHDYDDGNNRGDNAGNKLSTNIANDASNTIDTPRDPTHDFARLGFVEVVDRKSENMFKGQVAHVMTKLYLQDGRGVRRSLIKDGQADLKNNVECKEINKTGIFKEEEVGGLFGD